MQSLTFPCKSKNQLHASTIQGHRISIPIPKRRTGGHSEEILNQSKTKTSVIHTKSCSSVSTKCLVSKALVGCPSSIAACNTDVILLCVCSLLSRWLGALVSPPQHQSLASSWPSCRNSISTTCCLACWSQEGRKTPETFHSFMPPKLVPCGKYLKTRRPALIPFVHSSSSVTLLSRNKLEVYLGEVLPWPTVLLFQFKADLFLMYFFRYECSLDVCLRGHHIPL